MNTLSTNFIQKILSSYKEFSSSLEVLLKNSTVFPVNITGMQGSLTSFFLAEFINRSYLKFRNFQNLKESGYSVNLKKQLSEDLSKISDIIIIVPSEREAESLKINFSTICEDITVNIFPEWGSVFYKSIPSGSVVFGKRAGFLSKLASRKNAKIDKPEIFILTQRVFQTPLPPPSFILENVFTLSKGQKIDTVKIAEKLSSLGYMRVPKVSVKGEFSLRGEVLDIFLPDSENGVRIIFDFDQIEKIKSFNTENQTTLDTLDSILIYPMKEVIWNEELINILEEKLSDSENSIEDNFSGKLPFTEEAKKFRENLILNLRNKKECEGEEFFYPILWNKKYTILDYITNNLPVFLMDFDRLNNFQESFFREISGLYSKFRKEMCILPPNEMFFSFDEIVSKIEKCVKFRSILTEENAEDISQNETNLLIPSNSNISYLGNINLLKDDLKAELETGWKIFIFADSDNQALRVNEILKSFSDEKLKNPLSIFGKSISEGFVIPEIKLKVIQENEIFKRKKYSPKNFSKTKSSPIDTFIDLNPGDYVVHVNYGIGLFRGIDRVKALGNERDYIKIEYADEEFVFVPIEQVNLVQRYIGSEGQKPHLDRIGSKIWENKKNKVREAVEILAQKLIDLYSRRKASRGFAFPKETELQAMFEADFPYEDTPDQITVTEEIKKDMEKPVPMDRLICGDVGYGKTEIAMRAAFKAVIGGKQVAFLAPTTILAEQHYENCLERFQNFPVTIRHLSRFVSAKEQKKVIQELQEGKIDILIGTHRIIQKDVQYRNLGLMIIDEEQRFGVKDKEKLKVLKNNIDCLSMSATPIPRTLHMSLLKIRDMSLLTTPPQNRKPVETFIEEFSDEKIAKAVRQEVERGGQVFYLHNRVESLYEIRAKLEKILPEMLIDVAHGQMTSEQLDDIFRRFKMGGFHILVATTIIENGIDIPNVNTIIIDRADMYGISQLYQLRGRVGRSDKKAYAYLFYPKNKALSEIQMKRLQVISDFTELGSGFKIAMKDLEIRGAGNLLGKDQSGNVYTVGFDMYMRLLNEAVNKLMASKDFKEEAEVLLELEYSGFIPDSYVESSQTKMEIYKKIASIQYRSEFDAVYRELEDRFGPIPEEVLSLLSIAEIRIICAKLNISSIKEKNGCAFIEFAKTSSININKFMKIITEFPKLIQLDASKPNVIKLITGKVGLKEKSDFIRRILEKLM